MSKKKKKETIEAASIFGPEDEVIETPGLGVDVLSETLGNVAYSGLSGLIDEELGLSVPDLEAIQQAEFYLHLKRAMSSKQEYVLLRITYPGE